MVLVSMLSCKEEKTTLFSKVSSSHSGITFNNRIMETDSFNILTSEYIFNGGGVALGDFNNDSKPDIFFTGNQVPNKLYLNRGGFKFKDVSALAEIEAEKKWATGVTVVDINNDNFLDIYVCAAMLSSESEKANMLFVNQGPDKSGVPKFKEMAHEYGIADSGNSMNATFFDYDNDGFLDLYVLNNVEIHELPTNYREKITDGSALSNDRLYRNNGDGTFTDVTLSAGITLEGFGLGLAIADLNYDGWSDIYVSNDYLTNDILYINNKDGTFSNRIDQLIKHQSKFSMGSDISDFNNDGFLDIFTLDMLGETNHRLKTTIGNNKYTSYILNEKYGYGYQYMRNMLQMGNGIGLPYSEIGLMAGVSRTDWSWSPLFVDMDNDGVRDLLITNGFPRDITDMDFGDFNFNVRRYLGPSKILDSIPIVKIPNYAYSYSGNGHFKDVGKEWGLNIPSFSNGAAFADLDTDGDMDYIVNNINEEAFVFENQLNKQDKENHFLLVNLNGPKTNTSGIGAKIVVRFKDDTFQYHEHHLSRGYMSSVQDIIHFGLGNKKDKITSLEILWPDSKYQKKQNISENHTITLNYDEALSNYENAFFPLVPKKTNPIFEEISNELGINYVHQEKDVVDYDVQRILPHKLTQNGPCLAKGDLNGDGIEDFIVGSSHNYAPQMFFQQKDGTFERKLLYQDKKNLRYEEEAIVLFDLENDGDLDMYLVSGSNEFVSESNLYVDRLMINDGSGSFTIDKSSIPEIKASGSTVKAHDFDGDGYVDLFVGGRTPYAQYPIPEESYLLKNEGGKLKDVTEEYAKELRNVGMITDAVWADIDNDSFSDLIVLGQFMPITIFKNQGTSFEKLNNKKIDSLLGWWESILAEDFDNDGDVDLVAGNLGANNLYQPSQDRPITTLAKDFDNNGNMDPLMFAYFKNDFENTDYKSFPVHFWGDLVGQSPLFRSKFNYYKEYGKATQHTLLSKEELNGALKLTGNYDRTVYLENMGNGKFEIRQLPWQVQIAPINRMVATDFDEDGQKDLLLIGNNYGNEIFVGRYDALNGALLKGNGNGNFTFVRSQESGFVVTGDAKDIVKIKNAKNGDPYIVVTQNRGKIRIFQKK
ncbi:hypothetical protein D7Z94_13115 [Ulvibacterium marinum]|uniref:ASPIC/UnbV domain-containing protein n=2 Tax=Ulvibacterium marinum TaxID=2419782 RepID=A0A3B0C642_9FLAO|nr:hypothetical protein D7Z94_13115 [Ulvibacterium marinum]